MGDNGDHKGASAGQGAPRLTPRQRQVLELASIGLSDNEIGARLNMSSRTLRFQLEKIFGILGVRDRTAAIARWMDSRPQALRPADECPYRKPFPSNFTECPAYAVRQVVTLDEHARPTGRLWTCQQLEGRLMAQAENRWYGACVLGDTLAREGWAERAGRDRLRMINHLLHELAPLTSRFAQRLWKLKDDQARALARKQDPGPATRSMEDLVNRFIDDLATFLSRHRRLLEENQLPVDDCLGHARRLIDRVVPPRSPAAWDERFDMLMRFPEDVWSPLPSSLGTGAIQARR